jgi:antitoxin component of RelBE/YafQ-DinJ toxin-antitoxin module
MEERTAVITLRIEPSLKAAFENMLKKMDRTPSQELRGFIRAVVQQEAEKNNQGELELPIEKPEAKPKKGQRMAEAGKARLRT